MRLLFDFEQIAREKLIGFTRGERLVNKVSEYLRQPGVSPFLLITGGPGMGKSALAAHLWLVQKIPHAVHFCIGGRGGTLNTLSFVESVSRQLSLNTPRFGEALSEVQTSLPGRATYVVNQYMSGPVTNSEIIGVTARGEVSPAKAFDLLLRRPLQLLAQRADLNRTVILVDGLDESLTSASARRDEEFVKVLSQACDLPNQVRFIFTSKPDPSVRNHFEHAESIAIDAEDPGQQEDVRAFLRQRFQAAPALRNASERAGWSEEAFAENLAKATEFNFLYLTLVLPEIAEREDVGQVSKLPPTLDAYYRDLLQTRIGFEDWKTWGGHLAEIILAIQEPASLTQIAGWLEWNISDTMQRISQFGQLLDPRLWGQRLYWRHHFSLVNFLLEETRAGNFLCDGRRGHERVADYYLSEWGGWKEGLPDLPIPDASASSDKYPYRHLSEHLYLTGGKRQEALFALVDNRRWYEAQKTIDPSGATYLADLSQTWLAAEEYNFGAVARGSQARLMGREVRCALGITSLRAGIPAALLRALVKNGKGCLWSLPDALSAARNNPDSYGKAQALLALASLADSSKRAVIDEALAAADDIYQPWARVSVRAELAAQLPSDECRIVLEETFQRALEIDSEWQLAETLASLAPHLPEDLATRALDAARTRMRDANDRMHVLMAAAPRLPETQLRAALDDQEFPSAEYDVAGAVIRLLYLPEGHRESLSGWEGTLIQVSNVKDEVWQARLLAAMTPTLPSSLLDRGETIARKMSSHRRDEVLAALAARLAMLGDCDGALALAKLIWIPWRLTQALDAIASHLPPSRLPEALGLARSIEDDSSQAEALATLVDYLPESEREAVLRDALGRLKHNDADYQAGAIAAFAPYLPNEALLDALAAAERMSDESLMTSALEALAPHLPENLVERAFERARGLVEPRYEARALLALIPRLPASLMPNALDAVGGMGDTGQSASVLAALAPRLPDFLLPRALELAKWTDDMEERAEVFAALASRLPDALLRETLTAVQGIADGNTRARALAALIPYLPEDERPSLLREAFAAIGSEWHVTDRAHAALAQCLTEVGRHQEAIEHADSISTSGAALRVKAVAVLAQHLPHQLLDEAFKVASATSGWEGYVQALMALAPRLGERPLGEILDKVPKLNDRADRVRLLALVMPYLPVNFRLPLLKEALEAALGISDVRELERALLKLAPHVPLPLTDRPVAVILYRLWCEVLHSVTQRPDRRRQDLLHDIGALAAVLAALGGPGAVAEAVQAIQEVGKWWN